MLKKVLLIDIAAVLVVLAGSSAARAHFVLKDATTGMEAFFHATPNHSPIAGKESTISYDFSRSGYQTKDFSYDLSIKRLGGTETNVPIEVAGNVLIASYSFPSQGLYKLRLEATPNDSTRSASVFIYTQQVDRGVVQKSSNAPVELITLSATFAILLILFMFIFRKTMVKKIRGEKAHEKTSKK